MFACPVPVDSCLGTLKPMNARSGKGRKLHSTGKRCKKMYNKLF